MTDTQASSCPGYCGLPYDPLTGLAVANSVCGACPVGSRTNGGVCVPCEAGLAPYDVMYLIFWVLVVGLAHGSSVLASEHDRDKHHRGASSKGIVYLCALFEVLSASIFALLCSQPYGTLSLSSCPVYGVNDWYTVLYNPTSYAGRMHCDSEAVYPRWSIVLFFLTFSTILVMLVRIPIALKRQPSFDMRLIYSPLYYLPILAVVHIIFSGLLYYAFPYLCILYALVFGVIAMVKKGLSMWTSPEHLFLFNIRYLLTSFAIVAIFFNSGNSNAAQIVPTAVILPITPAVVYYAIFRD